MLLFSPDWSFTEPEQARQAHFGGEWEGLVGERTSGPVSAAERARLQVAKGARLVWRSRSRQMPALTFPVYAAHKQASQQRCRVLREWSKEPWTDFKGKRRGRVGKSTFVRWMYVINTKQTFQQTHNQSSRSVLSFPLAFICGKDRQGVWEGIPVHVLVLNPASVYASSMTQDQDGYVNFKTAIRHNQRRETWVYPINTLNSGVFSGRSQVQTILTDLWRKPLEESWLYFDWSYFEVCIVCFGNGLLDVNQALWVSHGQDTRQPLGFGSTAQWGC